MSIKLRNIDKNLKQVMENTEKPTLKLWPALVQIAGITAVVRAFESNSKEILFFLIGVSVFFLILYYLIKSISIISIQHAIISTMFHENFKVYSFSILILSIIALLLQANGSQVKTDHPETEYNLPLTINLTDTTINEPTLNSINALIDTYTFGPIYYESHDTFDTLEYDITNCDGINKIKSVSNFIPSSTLDLILFHKYASDCRVLNLLKLLDKENICNNKKSIILDKENLPAMIIKTYRIHNTKLLDSLKINDGTIKEAEKHMEVKPNLNGEIFVIDNYEYALQELFVGDLDNNNSCDYVLRITHELIGNSINLDDVICLTREGDSYNIIDL